MIFVDVENKLKYDTDRMELVSDKVEMEVGRPFRISVNTEIYRSKKADGWAWRNGWMETKKPGY